MPYREDKPLAEIIAPDRRRQKTVALVLGGMVAGGVLYVAGGRVVDALEDDRPSPRLQPTATASATASAPPSTSAEPFDSKAVEDVVRAHTTEVRRQCWDGAQTSGVTNVTITLLLHVAADGRVTNVDASGDDITVASCAARSFERVAFPPPGHPTTATVPLHFVRQ